jgi:hypothetical protein
VVNSFSPAIRLISATGAGGSSVRRSIAGNDFLEHAAVKTRRSITGSFSIRKYFEEERNGIK